MQTQHSSNLAFQYPGRQKNYCAFSHKHIEVKKGPLQFSKQCLHSGKLSKNETAQEITEKYSGIHITFNTREDKTGSSQIIEIILWSIRNVEYGLAYNKTTKRE